LPKLWIRENETVRALIVKISENKYLNIFIAIVCIGSGVSEMFHVAEEAEAARLHSGHGMLAIGLWNAFRAIGEALESAEFLATASEDL
jgi:hypothetical protein